MLRDASRRKQETLAGALLLLLAGTLCLFRLSGRDLWEPNEPISAQTAREMAASGDWLLPTVNGQPYPDKPPLLFWGILWASLPGGRVTETTARLPSALSGVALVLAIYFLSRRELGPRGAFLSAATLAVSNLFVEQARYVQHDMLLALGTTVAILALFRIADSPESRPGWIRLAAVALGFGVLGKGPVALVLPALIVAADTLLEPRIFRRWGSLGLAGVLGLTLPLVYYLALAHRHGGDLLADFLFRHNVERFVAGFDHAHPWWFFFARSPIDLLPATLLLPAAAFYRPEDPARRRFHRRLWTWIVVMLIFFTFSASKRPVYVLPMLPAAALLCGSTLDALAGGPSRRRAGMLAIFGEGAALALLGAAGVAAPLLAMRRAPHLVPVAFLLCFVTLGGSFYGMARLIRGNLLSAHRSLVASLAIVWMIAILRVYPAANSINSPRFFAEAVNRIVPREAPLKTYGLYRFRSGYIFYANRRMPRLPDRAALEEFLSRPEQVYCILPREDFVALRDSGRSPAHLLLEGRAGRREDCLISNRPLTASDSSRGSPGRDPAFPAPGARSGSGS